MSTLLSVNNYHYLRDGSEAVYLEHNRLFDAAGWKVVPFAMQHPSNLASPWEEHFVTEIEFGQEYSLGQKLLRLPKVIYSFEARKKLQRLLQTTRPTVAHCHSIYHHISPSILSVLKQQQVPTVMTLHDLKPACPAYHMFRRGEICERCKGGKLHNVVAQRCVKDSLPLSAVVMAEAMLHGALQSYRKNVDRFIVPCRFYQQKMVEWGWEAERFVHIPNFLDAASYQPDYTAGKDFLYFGRLSPEKGLITLIKAAARAKVAVSMAGDGPQLDELRELAQEEEADVTFLGHLSGENLHSAVRAARATVLPSEWYENAPISMLESYALGKPVIGAEIGGIPELIPDASVGTTFASKSVDELAATLRNYVDMLDANIEAMGRCARQLVEQEYSAARYIERVKNLYASVQNDTNARVSFNQARG
ncbi:MAG: glycosyltransferase family 4 protein [Pseudomonadales bacterium]